MNKKLWLTLFALPFFLASCSKPNTTFLVEEWDGYKTQSYVLYALATNPNVGDTAVPSTPVTPPDIGAAKPTELKRQAFILTATWCGPCQTLHAEVDKLTHNGKGWRSTEYGSAEQKFSQFVYVDVDKHADVVSQYYSKKNISIPVVVIIENGKVLRYSVGVMNYVELANFYNQAQ